MRFETGGHTHNMMCDGGKWMDACLEATNKSAWTIESSFKKVIENSTKI